ncbi:MAG: hypothetical protein H0T97_14285 [Actinobacteria bacterium]|nr:hypothetical protein [Actinomycetota bacterium]
MPRHFAFRMGEVLPTADPLSEWLVTLAVAMNDLTLVHVRLDEDQDNPELAFYWNRLAISHFTEAALFLDQSAEVEEVSSFVDSLPHDARETYDECLAVFNEHRGRLFSVRNKATFHYPTLRPGNAQAARPVRDALRALADDRGVIRSARIRDARALFADDVVAAIFAEELGGLDAISAFEARVAAGVTAFIRFANLALDEHLMRARESGATVEQVEPVDPADPRQGWRAMG